MEITAEVSRKRQGLVDRAREVIDLIDRGVLIPWRGLYLLPIANEGLPTNESTLGALKAGEPCYACMIGSFMAAISLHDGAAATKSDVARAMGTAAVVSIEGGYEHWYGDEAVEHWLHGQGDDAHQIKAVCNRIIDSGGAEVAPGVPTWME